jgi:hypothetical protein
LPERSLAVKNIFDLVHSDIILLAVVGLGPLEGGSYGWGLAFEMSLTVDALLEGEILVDIG